MHRLLDRRRAAGGAAAPSRYDPLSTATCINGRGLSGVFCMLCVRGPTYYFRASRAQCEPCGDRPLKLLLGLIFGLSGAAAVLVVWWRWVRNAHRDWWRARVDAWTRGGTDQP